MSAWRERFGEEPPAAAERLHDLLSRRSIRRFLAEPIAPEMVRALIGAGQSAASSSNLQCWSAVEVADPARRERIAHLVGDQRSVATAPLFLAILLDLRRLEAFGESVGVRPDALGTSEMLITGIVDAALGAERLMVAAERLGLGGCYIGGLRNQPGEVAALLELPPRTFGLFGLAIGRPDPERTPGIKPRLSPDAVLHRDVYAEVPPALARDYEARLAAFEGLHRAGDSPAAGWIERSAQRASHGGMSGREGMRESLRAQRLDDA